MIIKTDNFESVSSIDAFGIDDDASFYSALSKSPSQKVILIRLPNTMSAGDLDELKINLSSSKRLAKFTKQNIKELFVIERNSENTKSISHPKLILPCIDENDDPNADTSELHYRIVDKFNEYWTIKMQIQDLPQTNNLASLADSLENGKINKRAREEAELEVDPLTKRPRVLQPNVIISRKNLKNR